MKMNLKTHVREALRQLLSSKLRAFLAVLGILVGTASVVAMVSIGQLAENQILSQFKHLGINLLAVSVFNQNYSQTSSNPAANLSLQNADKIYLASKNITIAAPYVSSYGSVVYDGKALQGSSVGITTNMIKIAQLELAKGRFLSFLDKRDYYAMIGQSLYQKIQQRGISNPIGTQIQVGSWVFTIVGVLKKWPMNFFFNTDFNSAVLVPISTALTMQKNAAINNVAMKIADTGLMTQTENEIKKYVAKHTINKRVDVRSPKSLIDSMKKSSETMTILLGLIGSISLLVGGIGIMNIMLVSVAERHREIGIRKAIGAKSRDIISQFLIEAIVLSIFGGVMGMILGIVVTYIVSLFKGWAFTIFFLPPLIGCLVTIFVGIFFGFYPAWKASKLDPIQTLRSD